jgi:hypothetical protein
MKKNIIITLGIMFLILSSLEFTDKFNYRLLTEAFREHSGAAESLPAEIISLNALITKEKLQKFNLDGILNDDALFHQRAVEYIYPAKLDLSAKDIFVIKGSPVNTNCKLSSYQDNVEHYVCE